MCVSSSLKHGDGRSEPWRGRAVLVIIVSEWCKMHVWWRAGERTGGARGAATSECEMCVFRSLKPQDETEDVRAEE